MSLSGGIFSVAGNIRSHNHKGVNLDDATP